MKTFIIIIIAIFAAVGGWFFFSKLSSPGTESDIISRNGLHWHPHLTIEINGKTQEIPENVGMVPRELPIHTHEKDGIIHLEFTGLVKKDDLKLGEFFRIWGETFNKDCIFDKCSGPEGELLMLVDGKENNDFENYIMGDGDEIEIIFQEPSSPAEEITITGKEFVFSPALITVKAGQRVKLTFKNEGNYPHNLSIDGLGITTKTIGSGQTDTIEFTASSAGSYAIFCSVPGHREAGMRGALIIEK